MCQDRFGWKNGDVRQDAIMPPEYTEILKTFDTIHGPQNNELNERPVGL